MSYAGKLINRIAYFLPRILLISIFFLYVIFAFLTYFDYFEPYLYPLTFLRGKAVPVSENIIIGPFPHREELKVLKEKYGVTVVVSLLNLNLPQEKALFEREQKDAGGLGLDVFSYPMEYLPLQSESNRETMKKIIAFLNAHTKKKVYIHCYLGKHRVSFVKKGLLNAGFAISGNSETNHPKVSP